MKERNGRDDRDRAPGSRDLARDDVGEASRAVRNIPCPLGGRTTEADMPVRVVRDGVKLPDQRTTEPRFMIDVFCLD